MTRARLVFLLAVAMATLTGCDLMSSNVIAPDDGAPDLFQREKSQSDMPPRLFISLRIPSVACRDPDYYESGDVDPPDDVNKNDGRILAVKRRFDAPSEPDDKKFFVMSSKINNSVNHSNTSKWSNGRYPNFLPEFYENNVPSGHNLFDKFDIELYLGFVNNEDSNYEQEYEEDLPTRFSITLKSEADAFRGTMVHFGGTSGQGGGPAGTVALTRDYTNPDGTDFPSSPARFPAYLSYGTDNSGQSFGPQMGKAVLKFEMPRESAFLPALRKLARSQESDLEFGENQRTFRAESSNPYGVNRTLAGTYNGILAGAVDELKAVGWTATLVFSLGSAAPLIIGAVSGTAFAGAALVGAYGAEVQIGLALASEFIGPVQSGGVASLANAVVGAGTNVITGVPEEELNGCRLNGEGVIPGPDEPNEVGTAIDDAISSLSGPFILAGDVSRELQYTGVDVPGLSHSDVSWGRATTDSREEVVLSGDRSDSRSFSPSSEIYRVEEIPEGGRGESLIPLDANIVDVGFSSVAWEDTDQSDELQDLVISGFKESGFEPVTRLYRNRGGTFEAANAGLIDVGQGDVEWASHDGDSYLVVSGYRERRIDPADPVTKLYRDVGSGFEEVSDAGLVDVGQGDVEWADFVGDAKPDLAISGRNGAGQPVTKLYENEGGGSFRPVDVNIPGVVYGSLAWGDYDNDEDPDLTISGSTGGGNSILRIYENEGGGSFSLARDQQLGLEKSDAEWRDFNKDGFQDLVVTGESAGGTETAMVVIRNARGDELGEPRQYTGVRHGGVSWGDYDGDDDLDLIQVGEREDGTPFGRLLENRQ